MSMKKKPSLVSGTKGGKTSRSSKYTEDKSDGTKSKSKSSLIRRSKENIKRSFDVRKARTNYGDKIKDIEEEHEKDRQHLINQINFYRKENDKLLRQQENKFGMPLDEMEILKMELQQARSINTVLYHEVEGQKDNSDKLQSELESLEERLNELNLTKHELAQEKRIYKLENIELEKVERRISSLLHDNKLLRTQLLKNKIDPNADASKITPTTRTNINSPLKQERSRVETRVSKLPPVTQRRTLTPMSEITLREATEPKVWTRKTLMKFSSMEELRPPDATRKRTRGLRRTRSYSSQTHTQQTPEYTVGGGRRRGSLIQSHRAY